MLRAAEPWNSLFARSEDASDLVVREMRVIYKGGQPLLALPGSAASALACLSLYPAQTARARLARRFLRLFIQSGLELGMQRTRLEISRQDSFIRFLAETAGTKTGLPPEFGIFAGNPRSPGQRFIVLVCNGERQPVAVVKAGITKEARTLVALEAGFLKEAATRISGLPKVYGHLVDSRVEAMALKFFPGESPRETSPEKLGSLLGPWIDTSSDMTVEESTMWRQLKACPAAAGLASIEPGLKGKRFCSTLFHGDLAPWNVRVSPSGEWTVLDWERGQLRGLPGWDWFHFVIQPAVLVRKASLAALLKLVDQMLKNPAFRDYARKASIEGIERELLLAYLAHLTNVIRPSEGLEQNLALLNRLARG
jgi:hypothetical protein